MAAFAFFIELLWVWEDAAENILRIRRGSAEFCYKILFKQI